MTGSNFKIKNYYADLPKDFLDESLYKMCIAVHDDSLCMMAGYNLKIFHWWGIFR